MSITIWTQGEVFTMRIYKRLTARPDRVWANTYELLATNTPDGADRALQAATMIATWEASFHLTTVEFDRAVFSTFVPDSQPYQPDNFVSIPLDGIVGQRVAGGNEPLALDVCLLARKQVSFGRAGRWLYRGCLLEEDVQAPSGKFALRPASQVTLQGLINASQGEPTLEPILQALPNGVGLNMVMAGGTATNANRLVNGIIASGVVVKDTDNRYFDRAP